MSTENQNKLPTNVAPATLAVTHGSAGLYDFPSIEEILAAIDDWMDERTVTDPGEIALAKIWLRLRRETIKLCPGCDGDCGEDCAISAEQHWAALNNPRRLSAGTPPWPSSPND